MAADISKIDILYLDHFPSKLKDYFLKEKDNLLQKLKESLTIYFEAGRIDLILQKIFPVLPK